MKKFSKITNQKINKDPKQEVKKIDESDVIKFRMIDLMDKFLSIQTYGPVDKYQRAGLIKIMGKEMLAEAISDMLVDISTKDKTKLLESLKSEIKDWDVIDNKIESLEEKRPSLSNRNKIKSLLEMYSDESLLIEVSKNKVSKINKVDTLYDYIKLIGENHNLKDDTKIKMIEIYTERIKQIESVE
jgi:hypothetical protein